MRDDVKWAGLFGGGGVGFRVTHTHWHTHKNTQTPSLCFSRLQQSKEEKKGPYLPEPPLRKERGINTTFLFLLLPLHPFIPPHSWSPHCRRGQRPGEREGEVRWRGEESEGRRRGKTHLIRGWMIPFTVAWGGEQKRDDELLLLLLLYPHLWFHFIYCHCHSSFSTKTHKKRILEG